MHPQSVGIALNPGRDVMKTGQFSSMKNAVETSTGNPPIISPVMISLDTWLHLRGIVKHLFRFRREIKDIHSHKNIPEISIGHTRSSFASRMVMVF